MPPEYDRHSGRWSQPVEYELSYEVFDKWGGKPVAHSAWVSHTARCWAKSCNDAWKLLRDKYPRIVLHSACPVIPVK